MLLWSWFAFPCIHKIEHPLYVYLYVKISSNLDVSPLLWNASYTSLAKLSIGLIVLFVFVCRCSLDIPHIESSTGYYLLEICSPQFVMCLLTFFENVVWWIESLNFNTANFWNLFSGSAFCVIRNPSFNSSLEKYSPINIFKWS